MSKGNILIVEDEVIVANDIKDVLVRLGYDVVGLARTGEAAVDKALELNPDLILMDIMLKGKMSGIDAAARIKQRYDVPIVYLTAYSDDATLAKAKITQPFGYIIKPFVEKELHSVIEMGLYKHKLDKEKQALSEKVIKLTKRIPLTDNEKAVFAKIIGSPDLNDIELSETLGMKRSTITAIKNKLRREQYYEEYKFPNFPVLGCELLTMVHMQLDPNTCEYASKSAMIKDFEKLGCVAYTASTEREFIAVLFTRNITDLKREMNAIFKQYDRHGFIISSEFIYFPFDISQMSLFHDRMLGNLLGIRPGRDSNQHAVHFPEKTATLRELNDNERTILDALVSYPALNDTELAQRTKIPRPSISQTRRRLISDGFIKPLNVPHLLQLRCELLVYHHITLDQKMPAELMSKAIAHFRNNASNILVIEENNCLCTLGVYNDYTVYESSLDAHMRFVNSNTILIKEQKSAILTIPQLKVHKLDFARVVKYLLGTKA